MTDSAGKSLIIRAVIFDFDGTLARLNIDFQEMRRDILSLIASFGISENQLSPNFILETIADAHRILLQKSERQAQQFSKEAFQTIEAVEVKAAKNGELFTHTKPLLSALRTKKIACAVITRNCKKAVHTVFPDILDFCPVVVCRDDVRHVKPHPEHVGAALKALNTPPRNTVMIGDHPIDILAGHNAGTAACGVLTGRCTRDDFAQAKADIILADASGILDLLQ